ncbi:cellulose synthase family protein [Fulvivirga sediminis]|uniref:Glycosyltransferase family 2 protein n=1 Tax=Fulvivirga sediminis TaxID=2803949 RepID=A0A937K026_9BACT|nr:cellulose synthase family protein [Fulvivirga sediminis]MBL3655047.1 glycosyltransferase family 2 protein [Fulvivirga sediminis]
MIFEVTILSLYVLSLVFICFFSLGQLHLTWHYLNASIKKKPLNPLKEYPRVTVQLPVYNEKYVIERLIDAACSFDYPRELLEIQVLDDSTDETVAIIADKVKEWKLKGIDINHVTRADRVGFKAGALAYGLALAKGDFIAIFDADFLPNAYFLKVTLSEFSENTGMVQTRWGHINRDYSFLTKLQAFALDAHFSVEQVGRQHAGSFINFNGTGGIWRKRCIEDAGGWSDDTLTEDLDLSYRAQLKGWKFKYLERFDSPAELPVIMSAIKSQQYRWNKGAAETARKHFRKVLSAKMSWINKIHAFFHLFNSSVFMCVFVSAVLSVPMLYLSAQNEYYHKVFTYGWVLLIGFFSIAFYYLVATVNSRRGLSKYFFILFLPFLVVSMGLSLHNGLAVLEGLLGKKTPFVRTPKFNVISSKDSWEGNVYVKSKWSIITLLEACMSLYFGFGIVLGIYLNDFKLLFFHFMLSMGFAMVFLFSIKPIKRG